MQHKTLTLLMLLAALGASLLSAMARGDDAAGTAADRATAAADPAAPVAAEPQTPLPDEALRSLADLEPAIQPPQAVQPRALPAQARRLLDQGRTELADGDAAKAVASLERALGYDPRHPEIHEALAAAFASLENPGRQLTHLQAAVEAAPHRIDLRVALADTLVRARRLDDALLHYRTALQTPDVQPSNPFHARALLRTGEILDSRGYWSAAYEAYTLLGESLGEYGSEFAADETLRPLVMEPQRLLRRRGALQQLLRRPQEASVLLREAWGWERTDLPTARLLLNALASAGRFDAAERFIVELLGEEVHWQQLPALAHWLSGQVGDPQLPVRIWQASRRAGSIPPLLPVMLAQALRELHQEEQAIELLRDAYAQRPGNAALVGYLARWYIEQDRPADALETMASLLHHAPETVAEVRLGLGSVVAGHDPAATALGFAQSADATDDELSFARHYVAGALAATADQLDLAVQQFERAIEARGDFLPAYEAILDVHSQRGQFARVDELLDRLDVQMPQSPAAGFLRARALLARGDARQAIAAITTALQRDNEHIPSLLLLAEIYTRLGQTADAANALLEARTAAPRHPAVHEALYRHYLARNRFRQAEQHVRVLLEQNPNDLRAQMMLGELYLRSGRQDEAMQILDAVAQQAPRNEQVQLLVLQTRLAGRAGVLPREEFEQIAQRIQMLLQANPRNVDLRRTYAMLLVGPRMFARATEQWQAIYEQTGSAEDAQRYAAALLRTERLDDAIAVLERLLEMSPQDALGRQMLIEALRRGGQHTRAAELARSWVSEDAEGSTRYRLWAIEALEGAGDYDGMIELMEDWAKDRPQMDEALRPMRIRAMGLAGRIEPAVALIRSWSAGRDQPDQAANAYWVRLGLALGEVDRHGEAADLLAEAIGGRTGPRVEDLRRMRIYHLVRAGRVEDAQADAAAWIEQSLPALAPREALAGALMEVRQYDLALKHLLAWIEELDAALAARALPEAPTGIEATRARCLMTVARVRVAQGQYAEAIETIRQYYQEHPLADAAPLRWLESHCHSELGDDDQALAAARQAHAAAPDSAMAQNNLGYMYADRGIQLEQAEDLIRRAMQAEPNAVHIIDSMGWVLYKKGDHSRAAVYFDQILTRVEFDREEEQTSEGLAVMYDHAADNLYGLGYAEQASELWRQALEHARAVEESSRDIRELLASLAAKLEAVESGSEVPVAPLGLTDGQNP